MTNLSSGEQQYLAKYFSIYNVVGMQKKKSVAIAEQFRNLARHIMEELPSNETRRECLAKLEISLLYMRACLERQ